MIGLQVRGKCAKNLMNVLLCENSWRPEFDARRVSRELAWRKPVAHLGPEDCTARSPKLYGRKEMRVESRAGVCCNAGAGLRWIEFLWGGETPSGVATQRSFRCNRMRQKHGVLSLITGCGTQVIAIQRLAARRSVHFPQVSQNCSKILAQPLAPSDWEKQTVRLSVPEILTP